jgi:hypothetical protein
MDARHLYLLMAPAFACLLDAAVTLNGQPPEYWAGNYDAVHELSPDVRTILTVGPTVFYSFVAIWLLAMAASIVLLPKTTALALASAITIGHCAGATTWILWRRPYGYQIGIACCVIAGILLAFSVRRAFPYLATQDAKQRLNPWLRWSLVAIIIALPAYMFLYPH